MTSVIKGYPLASELQNDIIDMVEQIENFHIGNMLKTLQNEKLGVLNLRKAMPLYITLIANSFARAIEGESNYSVDYPTNLIHYIDGLSEWYSDMGFTVTKDIVHDDTTRITLDWSAPQSIDPEWLDMSITLLPTASDYKALAETVQDIIAQQCEGVDNEDERQRIAHSITTTLNGIIAAAINSDSPVTGINLGHGGEHNLDTPIPYLNGMGYAVKIIHAQIEENFTRDEYGAEAQMAHARSVDEYDPGDETVIAVALISTGITNP